MSQTYSDVIMMRINRSLLTGIATEIESDKTNLDMAITPARDQIASPTSLGTRRHYDRRKNDSLMRLPRPRAFE